MTVTRTPWNPSTSILTAFQQKAMDDVSPAAQAAMEYIINGTTHDTYDFANPQFKLGRLAGAYVHGLLDELKLRAGAFEALCAPDGNARQAHVSRAC